MSTHAVEFRFLPGSKFNQRSDVQQEALSAILKANHSGVCVAPCGAGKSALIIELGMKLAHRSPTSSEAQRVLILCYESAGVLQLEAALRDHTTLQARNISVQTGRTKQRVNSKFVFLVSTYSLFAAQGEVRNEASKEVKDFVFSTVWDAVLLDEVHHICAPTFKPFIMNLKSRIKLGFTATLYRNDVKTTETRLEHEQRNFGWFGPVLYRCTAADSERTGIIAKIRRAEVRVSLSEEFSMVYRATTSSMDRVYLAALNPQKLNALATIVGMHQQLNHSGIVFATHLLSAKIIRDVLGAEGWEILSGSNAHGIFDEKHSSEANRQIVKRFNAGELRGLISTAVGESSLDLHSDAFRYVVVLDADGGSASAAQKLGRVARTARLNAKEGETPEQLLQRRLSVQKSAAYYEINTRDTADESAARRRVAEFEVEGYHETLPVEYGDLVKWAEEEHFLLPFTALTHDAHLLKEVLIYSSLGNSVAAARAAAADVRKPQKDLIKKHSDASSNAGTKVFSTTVTISYCTCTVPQLRSVTVHVQYHSYDQLLHMYCTCTVVTVHVRR